MKNRMKYRHYEADSFVQFCRSHVDCNECALFRGKPKDVPCAVAWLDYDSDAPTNCPFCGRPEAHIISIGMKYAVKCSRCKACSGEYRIKDEAVSAWNRRATNE